MRKFSKRWFGPYVVKHVHGNATYSLFELDGTDVKIPIAGKRIKVFRKREDSGLQDVKNRAEDEDQSEDEDLAHVHEDHNMNNED